MELAEYFSNTSSKAVNKRDLEKDQIKIDSKVYESSSTSIEPEYKSFWSKIYYEYIVVDKASTEVSLAESFLYNPDLKPVEEERRCWSWFNFLYFWVADCFNINTWQVAATGLQLGLNWWQCWLTVWIGYSFVGVFVTLASRMGANYHVSFPISARASFGIFFSLWPIINRVVMAIVWYAVQSWIAMTPVSLMLKSIFGKNLQDRFHDGISSPNATTYEFMCFFIFWVISIPALLVPPHQIRHLFTVKAALVPFAAFGFLIWALKKSHGKIALGTLNDYEIHGSEFSWAFIRSIMACLANFATLIVNAPDFSRFSVSPNSSLWSQLFSIPILFAITSLIGILVTAAGYELYGVNYWSPLDVLARFLETDYTKGTRAGVFLISFVFTLAQLGTNISANSLSAGTDMTALLPKFINIRRGGVICAILALCICPWNLMASSNKFTSALSAYAVFLSSIAGIVCADYFVVRRGYIKLSHLYSVKKGSYYMYGNRFGINWRALCAYLGSILPNMTGFVGNVSDTITVPKGATYLYYLNYWVGYVISFSLYLILCYFFPVEGTPVKNCLKTRGWYEKWIEVEDFEEEWLEMMKKEDLYDDELSVLGE